MRKHRGAEESLGGSLTIGHITSELERIDRKPCVPSYNFDLVPLGPNWYYLWS
jgi:hypothetical protein